MKNSLNDNNYQLSICVLSRGNGEGGLGCFTAPKSIIKELLTIFKHNDEQCTLVLQIADEEYFSKLSIVGGKFKKHIPQTYKTIQFLENIPRDTKFILILGDATEDSTINNHYQIQKELHRLNGIEFPIIEGMMADSYNIYAFGDKKIYNGESDKKKRVCRFCGQSYPMVTFKKTAHAVSESLGNNSLFCNEECDNCNEKFGNGIELDLFNFHKFMLTLYGIRGKEGQRNLKGKTVEIDNTNDSVILIKLNQKSTIDFDDIKFEINEPSLSYIPQNVYKCLSKFAISLINRNYLSKLTKTIEWITSDEISDALPPVWCKKSTIHTQPIMGIYAKKECTNHSMPDFVFRVFICDAEYLLAFPYIDNQLVEITDDTKKCLNNLFKLDDYYEMNLSAGDKKIRPISFEINKEGGTEIVNVNKSEFEKLSEQERVLKYPNASGFFVTDDSKIEENIDNLSRL